MTQQQKQQAQSRQLKWYRERKSKGLCTVCGKQAARKRNKALTLCETCKAARKVRNKKAWAARKLKQSEPEFD